MVWPFCRRKHSSHSDVYLAIIQYFKVAYIIYIWHKDGVRCSHCIEWIFLVFSVLNAAFQLLVKFRHYGIFLSKGGLASLEQLILWCVSKGASLRVVYLLDSGKGVHSSYQGKLQQRQRFVWFLIWYCLVICHQEWRGSTLSKNPVCVCCFCK